MKDTGRIKFVSDVDVDGDVKVEKPLKLKRDDQRRFVRLEIVSPMSLGRIKDGLGNFCPDADEETIPGVVLNISGGGALLDLERPVGEGDIVAMRFSLENIEPLEGVLGVVKRSEPDADGHVVGIQFVKRDQLADRLSQSELDMLPEQFSHFSARVHDVLNRYVSDRQA